MRKLLITLVAFLAGHSISASHIAGGNINVRHIDSFDFVVELVLYLDDTGLNSSPTAQISIYSRDSVSLVQSISLPRINIKPLSAEVPHCNPTNPYLDKITYRDTITFFSFLNNPSGYVLVWNSCCRNVGVVNMINSAGSNRSIVTFIPPIADSLGLPIINSTPVLKTPVVDKACKLNYYVKDFGGFDLDGDSIDHVLYVPFTGQVAGGIPSPLSAPYPDPLSMFGGSMPSSGYSVDDLIHGYPPPNPSPNRLQIDLHTGELTVNPIGPIGYYTYGIWTREYRNGVLIGSVFRELQMVVENCDTVQNSAPFLNIPQNQSQATWNGDTLEFSTSSVCVDLMVMDPDSLAVLMLEAEFMNYDSADASFTQDSAYLNGWNVFNTSMCFDADSFQSQPSYCKVIVKNPGCFESHSDTASFWFRYVGYSNAGIGGTYTYEIGQIPLSIDLISLLNGNPNLDGTWYDLDSSAWLNAQGIFQSRYINSPSTFRFMYVDNKPNYLADTSYLTLNFVYPSGLERFHQSEIIIYPNPSRGEFTLSVDKEYIGVNAEIFSIDLKKVLDFEIEFEKQTISIEKEGMYFLRLGGDAQVRKILIEN